MSLQTSNYLTYDQEHKKFLGITLEQPVRNVAVYDDLHETLPKTIQSCPNIESMTCLKSFSETTMQVLLWVN